MYMQGVWNLERDGARGDVCRGCGIRREMEQGIRVVCRECEIWREMSKGLRYRGRNPTRFLNKETWQKRKGIMQTLKEFPRTCYILM